MSSYCPVALLVETTISLLQKTIPSTSQDSLNQTTGALRLFFKNHSYKACLLDDI